VATGYIQQLSAQLTSFSVGAGGSISLHFSDLGKNSSVLLVQDDECECRLLPTAYKHLLVEWFLEHADQAWDWVHARYSKPWPDKIFLVTKQIMAEDFYLGHFAAQSKVVNVTVAGKVAATGASGGVSVGHESGTQSSSTWGFAHPKHFWRNGKLAVCSIAFEVHDHFPSQRGQYAKVRKQIE
jgi:hypothetical protein